MLFMESDVILREFCIVDLTRHFCQPELEKHDVFAEIELKKNQIKELELEAGLAKVA